MTILDNWKKRRMLQKKILSGWKLYRKIKIQYGKDTSICVSQHPALGDAYLAGLYLNAYYGSRIFIVTAVSEGAFQVYRYLGIQRIALLTQEETDCLIAFCQMAGLEQEEVRILHHQALQWHTGILWQLQGVHGLNFADMFENAVFPGISREDRIYPDIQINQNAEKMFDFYGLEKGNTVILFPYANTLIPPDQRLWMQIIKQLRGKGKCMATYVFETQQPLAETMAVRAEIKDVAGLAELAGEMIGVRSGLMDILSIAKCRKIILYPRQGAENWIHGSLKEFWSVKAFGYCDDVEEYEYDTINQEEITW